jgi:hypothetical protein
LFEWFDVPEGGSNMREAQTYFEQIPTAVVEKIREREKAKVLTGSGVVKAATKRDEDETDDDAAAS